MIEIIKDIFNMTLKEWLQSGIFAVMVYGSTYIFMALLGLFS